MYKNPVKLLNIQKNKNIKLDNTHKVIPYPKNRKKDDKKKGNKKKNTNTSKVNKKNKNIKK